MNLLESLTRLAQIQRETVDRLALQEAASAAIEAHPDLARKQLLTVTQHLQVGAPKWLNAPDPAALPALICAMDQERAGDCVARWGVIRALDSQNRWVTEWWNDATHQWQERADDALPDHRLAVLKLSKPFDASKSPVFRVVWQEVFSNKRLIREVVLGGLMINFVALAVSFYSMQVYDRVVPTGASQTLLVLTLGVMAAMAFELLARWVRSNLYERLIDQVDKRLARTIYMRFLAIRMDQLPRSVGALAGQMRGYETVRGFFTSVTTNFLVDAPFAILFMLIMYFLAGGLVLVPAIFFVLSVCLGLYFRGQVDALAHKAVAASNQKTGLLVETVEGAETIKSGQGGWRMLSRWMKTTDLARQSELQMRTISEHGQHLTASFQQISYVLLVAAGALMISKGELTMGALIACSILSGRVLAPVAMIPNQLVQWAHAKASLQGLDMLWALQDDHHGQPQAVLVENIRGHYRMDNVAVHYGSRKALSIANLNIQPGEKIGVLGPVGAGKTTLLRLLTGMYKPQQGQVLLDDLDLAYIAKPVLADAVGYVQQDGRLFAGSLRENLVLGQMDPGEEAILQAARATGLLQAVIAKHPQGLEQEIFEGGTGLSGGQRQLLNLTRIFLRKPSIWLLDEPTASMDRQLEIQVTQALKAAITLDNTLVLVTHKVEMLELVDRIIVVANHQIVMDGPKAHVLQKLQGAPTHD
jgi:ATP-binding cassette subfamily C protein LapB